MVKNVAASLCALLLLYAGLLGRQHARLQARLQDTTVVRNHLQRMLDEANPQVTALVSALKARLAEFDSHYHPDELAEDESLEIRLSKATLANAEQRFTDALIMVTEEDERKRDGRFVRVLHVRGDSFYGLREWRNALERYHQMVALEPDRIVALERAAACHHALGRRSEAIAAYCKLASSRNDRGEALLVQGRWEAALKDFNRAVEIYTRLIEQEKQSDLAVQLVRSLNGLAAACADTGSFADAVKWQEKAIELAPEEQKVELRGRLELYRSRKSYRRAE